MQSIARINSRKEEIPIWIWMRNKKRLCIL